MKVRYMILTLLLSINWTCTSQETPEETTDTRLDGSLEDTNPDQSEEVEEGCQIGEDGNHYQYLINIMTLHDTICRTEKVCSQRPVITDCGALKDGQLSIENSWTDSCNSTEDSSGTGEIIVSLTREHSLSTIRLSADRCRNSLREILISASNSTSSGAHLVKLQEEDGLIVVGEISPPLTSDVFTVSFVTDNHCTSNTLFLAEVEMYSIPDGAVNVLSENHVTCGQVRDPTLTSTCLASSGINLDCTCLFDGDTASDSTYNISWTFYSATVTVDLNQVMTLWYIRVYVEAFHCTNFQIDVKCGQQYDVCQDGTSMSTKAKDNLETTTEPFWFIVPLNELITNKTCVLLRCLSDSGAQNHIRVLEMELYGTPDVETRATSPATSTTVTSARADTTTNAIATETTATETTTTLSDEHPTILQTGSTRRRRNNPDLTSEPEIDQTTENLNLTRFRTTTHSESRSTATTTVLPPRRFETTAAPGLAVDCGMKLLMPYEDGFGITGSLAFLELADPQSGTVRRPVEDSFNDVFGLDFQSTHDWVFSEGSVDTQYTADLSPDSEFNADHQENLRNTLIDYLDRNNISVDPDSIDFTPRTTPSSPPAKADTEQLLLAGVMGAVVTLLVIALAIAAVAVRLCINRRKREQRGEAPFDNMNGRDANAMQHYNGYPGTMPPPYTRNGSVSTQSQSSLPAYFTSSLPRYGRYPFQSHPPRQPPNRRAGSDHDAFEFPTPLIPNGMPARRAESDVSDDSRHRNRSGRRQSSLTGYVPRNTQLPRVTPSHRQQSRDYSAYASHPRTSRTIELEPSLHRNGTGLSTEDLIFGPSRPRLTRQDTHDSGHKPRLRRLPSGHGSEGQDSRTRSNDAFEDDALRPYYLANDEREEPAGLFDRLSRTIPISRDVREDEPDNLHRQKPSYMKGKKNKTRKESENSRISRFS